MIAQNDEKSSHLSLEREREMQNCLGIYVEEKIIKYAKVSKDLAGSVVSISLIFISAFLTALNLFNRIGKFAGAGTLIPITGFANSIISPAMEYKSEGYVMGVGAKMFTVAGPVLVYGICSSVIVGIVYLIFNTQAILLV